MASRKPAREAVFAADLGGTKLAVALLTAQGKFLARRTEPVEAGTRAAPVRQIVRLARALAAEHPAVRVVAAAVAVPGLVRRDGTVWAPNLPGWNRMPLAAQLKRALAVPVAVESDRNAAMLGESWMGAARGASDAIVLIVGTGIGAGILAGGKLLRGVHELSGCVGWMVTSDATTPAARRMGQLEALAAGPAVARTAARMGVAGAISAERVAAAARSGNAAARQVFRDTGRRLGVAIANLISLFDPAVIVLSGGMAAAADLYFDELKRTVRQHAQPLAAPKVRIKLSRLGADANLLGAAHLAWKAARR